NELYFWEDDESENDLILFTGNTQAVTPEGQYIIADEVLDTCVGFGVKRVYCIAGFRTGRPVERPRVYGAVTDRALMEKIGKYGVLPMREGNVGGVNGLLFGLAKTKGLEGICLLGETPGYTTATGHQLVDTKAVRAVLDVVTKMLGIEVDMAPLEEQIKQTEELIERLAAVRRRMDEEVSRAASEAETRYII
ncbi:MAG: PAC2 family protein, partial [Candidatus Bathyarchaeia archaeon]